ncbi:MAG TPA: phytochelatin synthase family protein [Victivallales bacterium]|nr:phytochelatin synthase family protein [Victivallales bacterium]
MKLFTKTVFVIISVTLLSYGVLASNNSLINYNSIKGQNLLSQSLSHNFLMLSQNYETQANRRYCAVASAVITLNSLMKDRGPVDPHYAPFKYFTQTDIFTPAVLKITTPADIYSNGLTLDQEAKVLKTFGVNVKIYHAGNITSEKAGDIIKSAIHKSNTYVIANILQPSMSPNIPGGGHFSPLAAYNIKENKVLFLDVARYEHGPYWISMSTLYNQMNTIDGTSKVTRGFLVVSNNKK